MKKVNKLIFLLVVIIFVVLSFYACDTSEIELSFDANGGAFEDGKEIHSITVQGDSELDFPNEPVKDGYNFIGWFLDDETFESLFSENSLSDEPVKNSFNVYAKWEIKTYTVTFDGDGGVLDSGNL